MKQTLVPSMLDYIAESPHALLHAQRELPGALASLAEGLSGPYRRIDLVGSGTSLHAALAVREFMLEQLDAELRILTPIEYLEYALAGADEGVLVVGISQTGRSTGTNLALSKARRAGAATVLVTGWPDSEGAAHADNVLDIACGPEYVGARTKGYLATVHALIMLTQQLSGLPVGSPLELPGVLERTIEKAATAITLLADDFEQARAIWIVSYGSGMATAREAALKLLETVRIPVLAFDVEEYMHGPYHCLEHDTALIFIAPAETDRTRYSRERMSALIGFVSEISRHTLLIAPQGDADLDAVGHAFPLEPSLGHEYSPLQTIPLLQMLAAELTLRQGREPGVSRYPDFHDRLGSKTAPPLPTPPTQQRKD